MEKSIENNIGSILKKNSLSVTDSRKKILSLFLQSKDALAHGDIEKKAGEKFDRVTIYRTLQTFVEKGYPDTAAMGKLSFDIIQVKPLSNDHYFVVGKWMLQRTAGNLSGHYTLLLRRMKNGWKIVADHSS